MGYDMAKKHGVKILLYCFVFLVLALCSARAQTRVEITPGLFYTCNGNIVIVEEDERAPSLFPYILSIQQTKINLIILYLAIVGKNKLRNPNLNKL
jgi:hypothetical protein